MPFVRAGQAMLLVAALAITPAFASRIHRAATSGHANTVSSRKSHHHFRVKKIHGQRAIDSERATQIQAALISKKYLSGAPSGQWDTQTQAAMQKYQADHGWQTRLMPDSRALISLGLGPEHPADAAAPHQAASAADAVQSAPSEPAANTLASVHSISQ